MTKRNASDMSALQRECVFEIMAANFSKAVAEARREADDDEQYGSFGTVDKMDCLAQSALIDPSLLPPTKKTKFADLFGSGCVGFCVNTENMVADSCTEYPVRGAPGIKGIQFDEVHPVTSKRTKTFVEQGSYQLDDPNGDQMVVIRIKTGKGGRQQFRVPKRVAKDMVGCD